MKERKQIRNKLILEGILALVIAITPIVFYSYKYIPDGKEKIDLLIFSLTSNGFGDAGTALYYYLTKLVPLVLLVFWFVTCKNWWYHTILIPISMYAFQLYSSFASDSSKVDENEILYIVAVTMVIVPIVYFIRIKLFDKHVHGIDLDSMNTELQILKEKEELRKEREKLEQRHQTLSKKM
ncbi:hypothetical protein DKG77_12235 [Flagellimonas aquimarina]|uniref:Uncharacterized protein n=1 Tax=Flagellimonas aquimarina TaxID=2201895 RepID=A0A316LGN1_9FLAO|nr:hypothetical protein [Allomuricauda koreensis]PWL39250.1 hypothetical protein DKG77_12235 [Allomuricauda koreensis]